MPYRIPDAEAVAQVFDLLARGGALPRRLLRHERGRRDPHGAGPRAGPHHRDRCSATSARATSRSCSTRRSCAPRACRFRTGWSGGGRDLPDAWAATDGRASPGRSCAALALARPPGAAAARRSRRAGADDAAIGRTEVAAADRRADRRSRHHDRRARGDARAARRSSAPRRWRRERAASRRSTSSTPASRRWGRRRRRARARRRRSPAPAGRSDAAARRRHGPGAGGAGRLQRADGQIAEIDRIVRARFSAELMSRGPSPLPPDGLGRAGERDRRQAGRVPRRAAGHASAIRSTARIALRRLPVNVVLLLGGIAVTLVMRRWLMRWVDQRLLADGERAGAWPGWWRCATCRG